MDQNRYTIHGPPSNRKKFSLWCVERLQEHCQASQKSKNLQIFNKIKLPKKKVHSRFINCGAQNTQCRRSSVRNKVLRMSKVALKKQQVVCKPTKPLNGISIQVFVHSDVSGPLTVHAKSTDTVSTIKANFTKCHNIPESSFCLATNKGFVLCDGLTLEDHGIREDSNLYVKVSGCGLKGGADVQDGSALQTDNPSQGKSLQNALSWSRVDVRRWLQDTVQLAPKYIERMFKASVDGECLLLYKREDLQSDFQLKKGPLWQLLKCRDELQTDSPVNKKTPQLPIRLKDWDTNQVKQWLEWKCFEQDIIDTILDEEVDGKSLSRFHSDEFKELEETFCLKKGPLRKLIYLIEMLSEVPMHEGHGQEDHGIPKDGNTGTTSKLDDRRNHKQRPSKSVDKDCVDTKIKEATSGILETGDVSLQMKKDQGIPQCQQSPVQNETTKKKKVPTATLR